MLVCKPIFVFSLDPKLEQFSKIVPVVWSGQDAQEMSGRNFTRGEKINDHSSFEIK